MRRRQKGNGGNNPPANKNAGEKKTAKINPGETKNGEQKPILFKYVCREAPFLGGGPTDKGLHGARAKAVLHVSRRPNMPMKCFEDLRRTSSVCGVLPPTQIVVFLAVLETCPHVYRLRFCTPSGWLVGAKLYRRRSKQDIFSSEQCTFLDPYRTCTTL